MISLLFSSFWCPSSYSPDNGAYIGAPWNYNTLVKLPNDTFQFRKKTGTVYQFGLSHKIESITDRNGNKTTFAYDELGNLESITTPSGENIAFTHELTAAGRLRIHKVYDPTGVVWEYVYSFDGNLISVINPLKEMTHYEYGVNNLLTKETDALGAHRLFTYYDDTEHRLQSSSRDDDVQKTTFVYGDNEPKITIEDALGREITIWYDTNGQVVEFVNAKGNSSFFKYDNMRNLVRFEDEEGVYLNYDYDDIGNLLTISDALTSTISFTYDEDFNLRTSRTDQLGNTTAFIRDPANGNLITIVQPDGAITNFAYDEYGNVTLATDALGNESFYSYTDQGLLEEGHQKDENNNDIITLFAYTPNGDLFSTTDPNDNTTTYAFDLLRRLTRVTNALTHETAFEYDEQGNIVKMTNALGLEVTFTYDEHTQLTSIVYPDTSHEDFEYDLVGNMTLFTNRIGQAIDIEHDELNRRVAIVYPDTTQRTFTYDRAGRMLTATNAAGTVTLTYNDRGLVESVQDIFGKLIYYEYDVYQLQQKLWDLHGLQEHVSPWESKVRKQQFLL